MDCENWYSAQGTVEAGALVKELKVSRIRIELHPRKAVEGVLSYLYLLDLL